MVGIICPTFLFEIGLTYLPKSGSSPSGSYSLDHYVHRAPQILTPSARTEKEMRVDKKQASEFFFNICLH